MYLIMFYVNNLRPRRFMPKAQELQAMIGNQPYPSFEQLYELIVNKPYDPMDIHI